MDHDEKARSMVGYIGPKHVAEVAAALRESAAEAFEEAANHATNLNIPVDLASLAIYYMGKAAALRSTTRGKS